VADDSEQFYNYVQCLSQVGTGACINKPVLSLVPRLSTRRCPHLLLSACAAFRSLSIDICCPRSAANPPHTAAAVDRRDGRTDTRPLHRPCSAYRAESARSDTQFRRYARADRQAHRDTLVAMLWRLEGVGKVNSFDYSPGKSDWTPSTGQQTNG